jgi:hypothetical protein
MQIASCPDPEFPDRSNDVLWLLTDERGDFRDQATATAWGTTETAKATTWPASDSASWRRSAASTWRMQSGRSRDTDS